MKWNEEEINFLNEHYEKYGLSYCSEKLNRHKKSVQTKAKRLNLKFKKNFFYLSEDFENVVKNCDNLSDVCKKLNLTSSYGNRKTIKKYIKIKNINVDHFYSNKPSVLGKKIDIKDILIENSTYNS